MSMVMIEEMLDYIITDGLDISTQVALEVGSVYLLHVPLETQQIFEPQF